jgi:hypothetical protein
MKCKRSNKDKIISGDTKSMDKSLEEFSLRFIFHYLYMAQFQLSSIIKIQ